MHGGDPGAELVLDVSAENTPAGSIALFSYGFWPSFYEDIVADRLEIEDDQTVVLQEYQSIEDLVAAHLVETDVAVFIGFSVEKMRYIDGHALAVNARGERRTIDLQNIYGLAEEIATEGTPVSHASC